MREYAFVEFCKNNTPKEVGELLRKYVSDGQPRDFLPGFGSRTMCHLAADEFKGRYGGNWDYMDFYEYMWGDGSDDCLNEAHAEGRRARHIRCGMPLDRIPWRPTNGSDAIFLDDYCNGCVHDADESCPLILQSIMAESLDDMPKEWTALDCTGRGFECSNRRDDANKDATNPGRKDV